jgi:hypothetical protein
LRQTDDGELYLAFDIQSGAHYQLNETAYWILRELDGTKEAGEILGEFLEQFGIDRCVGSRDFWDTIDNGIQLCLLEKEIE